MKGLRLEVLRSKYGDKGTPREITVVNLGRDSEVFEATPDAPAYRLERHRPGCLRLVPVTPPRADDCVGPMMSGHYAATSDSRFREACDRLLGTEFYGAVAVHDHYETAKEYASHAD